MLPLYLNLLNAHVSGFERLDYKTVPTFWGLSVEMGFEMIGIDGWIDAFLKQIYQGRYRNPQARERQLQQEVYSVEDLDQLAPGMLSAVDVEKYQPEKQQIAKVLSMKDQGEIEVLWYYGTWSGSWHVYRVRQGRNMIESKEVIPLNTVRLFNFTFTLKLKQSIKTKLREIYTNEDGSDQE